MNEIKILNYILHKLTSGEDTDALITELQLVIKLLEEMPSYDADKIINIVFGGDNIA